MTQPHHSRLHGVARRWRGRRVGLYGGSFNPAHDGHRHVAEAALKSLQLDAVWLLVSPGNPHKGGPNGHDMAPFPKRLASAQKLAQGHPKLYASDVEFLLGCNRSVDTIAHLQKFMPTTRFYWIMGADNMLNFHRWWQYDRLVNSLPIAIFDRPGYSIKGFGGLFAQRFRQQRKSVGQLVSEPENGWAFVRAVRHPASATQIRSGDGLHWVFADHTGR